MSTGKGLGKGGMFHRTSGFKGNFTSTTHLNQLNNNGHPTIWCDQCSSVNTSTNRPTTFIQGVRYRCSMCPNFDLCSRCIEPNVKQHPSNHLFLRIDVEQRDEVTMFPAAVNRSAIVHPNSTCIGCNKSGKDFQGVRYQCAQCQIDLCEACEMQGIHDTSHMRLKFSTGMASQQQSPQQRTTSDAPNKMAFMMHPTSGRDGFVQSNAQGNQTPSSPQPLPPCTCSGTFGRPCVACRTRIGPGNFAVSTFMARTESGRSDGNSSGSWNPPASNVQFGMAHQTSGRDGTFGGNNSSGSNNSPGTMLFGMAHQTSGRDGTFGGNNSNNTTFGSGTK